MISSAFDALLFTPLYNGLVFLISLMPYADIGLAVIVLTVFVKLVLFPLSLSAAKTQLLVKRLEPEIAAIRKARGKDKQAQARETMELYRKHGVNPFSSIFLILVQLPIIFALYFVFLKGNLPVVNADLLYSFVPVPEQANIHFLGFMDLAGKSVLLALLAGATQFLQARLSLPPLKARESNATLKDDLARSFHLQMRYVLPFIVTGIAYVISAAVALYWTTSNIFAIAQELYVRRRLAHSEESAQNHESARDQSPGYRVSR